MLYCTIHEHIFSERIFVLKIVSDLKLCYRMIFSKYFEVLIIFNIVCHSYNCIVWTVNYITFSLSDLHVKPQVVLLPAMCTCCCLSGSTWATTALRKEMAQGWQSQRTVAFCPELWNESRACWVLQTFIMTLDIPPSLPKLSSLLENIWCLMIREWRKGG